VLFLVQVVVRSYEFVVVVVKVSGHRYVSRPHCFL